MNFRDALKLGVTLLVASAAAPAGAKNKMKMTTDTPSSITTPDKVETRIGTLKFFDGFPDKTTVEKSTTTSISSAGCRRTSLLCPPFRLRVYAKALLGSGSVQPDRRHL